MTDSIEATLWRGISADERARILADPAPHLAYLTARIGERELKGAKHNPLIVAWGKAAGIGWWNNDEDPWCAVGNNGSIAAVGGTGTRSAMARSFADPRYGTRLAYPVRGAVFVIPRPEGGPGAGHTGFVEQQSADGKTLYVVNANVSDQVKRSMVATSSLLPDGLCWPEGIPLTPEAQASADAYRVGHRGAPASAILKFGSSGPAVVDLKERYLIPLGADLTGTDYFGANTRRAVERIQERLGVEPDGIVGPLTRAALEKAVAEKTRAQKTKTVAKKAVSGGAVAGGVAVGTVATTVETVRSVQSLNDGTVLGLVIVLLLLIGGGGFLAYHFLVKRQAARAADEVVVPE